MKLHLLLLLSLAACSRAQNAPAPDASPAPPAVAATDVKPSARFEGTYASKRGSLYVPDGAEFKGAQWRGDDAGDGVGDCTLELTVDSATGRIEGKGRGALGEVVLVGVLSDDGTASFAIRRANASDGGFTGSATGKLSGNKIEGTMRLSRALADAIRDASFTLTRK